MIMKKPVLALLLMSFLALPAISQTLFTYGSHKVTSKEFLRAFDKNNPGDATGAEREKAMRDYLDLYINSRLKIQEAYARGYDTLPRLKSEMDNLRNQIIDPYLSDPNAIDRLRREAFLRSQKDIRVAHIFISLTDASGKEDTLQAGRKLRELQKELSKGTDFQELAARYSDDPAAKENRGDLHYITVFTLPYAFENIIYQLKPGKVSAPFRSRAGFHLFKNLGERKALGKIRIQQILLAIPPQANAALIEEKRRLADSIYQLLKNGAELAPLAKQYSNDLVSSQTNGQVPDIVVGQYESDFETFIANLAPGELGKPFQSAHGFHIVKKTEQIPVAADSNDVTNREWLEQKILNDDRWKTSRDFIYTKVKANPGIRHEKLSRDAIWGISDSLLDYRPAGAGRGLTRETVLFSIGKEKTNVNEWIRYAQMNRYRTERGGMKPYTELWDDFEKQAMYQYYRNNLEQYNEEFRIQMSEFRDGNLFFEIMQEEVWNKAQEDTLALRKLYAQQKDNYLWGKSARALLFFCPDSSLAVELIQKLRGNTQRWQQVMEPYRDRVVADSGRYEWEQLPGLEATSPKAGEPTAIVSNPVDRTSTFAWILEVYTQPSPRSFEEARGLVMNDYQAKLEEEWIKRLKKKYPVKVNEGELRSIK
jgi:peptidyl-prolyl cis-trans isomerase SurA